ncbi:MAG TPA: GMC family oxidoreductase [Solirubrobacteraceae bacterium]|nr:GMC family oxidoreductase [Solirubrobacteraceae bacterium]
MSPDADIPREFAAIVVGSGFGGSVAAYRLQQECRKKQLPNGVLLLERGMPYPPRSFPRTPHEMQKAFWDPDSALYGLYEVWSFRRARMIVSSGLGGGSLIYANVLIRKPPDTFKRTGLGEPDKPWPINARTVADHYKPVSDIIDIEPLPRPYYAPREGTPLVPKTAQFIDAAGAAGLRPAMSEEDPSTPWLAPLAVAFRNRDGASEPGAPLGHVNLHGRPRRTCTLVGECDLGCNEGAKNSLDYNYLSRFQDAGGTIRTCCEAVEVKRLKSGRYEVRYRQHGAAVRHVLERAKGEDKLEQDSELLDNDTARPSASVEAGVVVLAAGALGSPRLLLRSRASLPPLSPALGRRFSSNGDLILFARDCTERDGRRARNLAPSRGPVITAAGTSGRGDHPLWVEDAGGPSLSEWGWQLPELAAEAWKTLRRDLSPGRLLAGRGGRRSWVSATLAAALGTTRPSSAMLPLLAMGLDNAGGRLRLDRDALTLSWDPADSASHFYGAEAAMERVAENLGGRLWPEPQWLRRLAWGLTVHPLGGAPMGENPTEGVVDVNGEVFGCRNLFVADGSVMPGPVGPNPSLTIAAIADHIADTAVKRL